MKMLANRGKYAIIVNVRQISIRMVHFKQGIPKTLFYPQNCLTPSTTEGKWR